MLPFAFLPTLQGPEILIIGFVALLVFGNRLPGVMRSLGRSVTEFKKGISGIEDEIAQAGNDSASKPANAPTDANADAASTTSNS